MSMAKILGAALVILGVVAFLYQGISYTTTDEVADIGPLEIQTKETETLPLPPLLGAIALIGGIALIVASSKNS